jgi:PKD repeat protein
MMPLAGSFGQLPQTATPTGSVAGSAKISFDVALSLPQTVALQNYLSGLTNPSSPYYQHYMPFQQFYSEYGPSSAQVQALTSYLTGYGLSVTSTGGPLIYGVSGTASQVNQALHVSMTNYVAGSTSGFAPSGTPELPSSIASLVGSFQGLNSFANPQTLLAFPSASPTPLLSEVSPSVMRGFYNETALLTAGNTGKLTIGLAEECSSGESSSGYTSDLNDFDSAYGLPSATVTYVGSGASSCSSSNGDWYEETDLDIQWAHTMAPSAPIIVCLDTSNPDVCDQTFLSDGVSFGSNSWGGGSADHSVWQSAMAAGITLLASSGDSAKQVNYPAAEPDGIGVGGTSITPSGSSFGSETAWADSGGGCDTSDAPPSYQVGMTGYPGACSSTSDRGVPDVAMDANPNSGVPVYINGANEQIGGTSLACPMWAASLDVIYAASGFTGFAAPTIYSLAKSTLYGSLFHDITSGSNGYSATVGWDPVTGVGSPNIGALAAHFNGGSTTLTASASASPTSGTAPLAVTFTGSASGGTSPYTWSWNFGDSSTGTSQSPSHTYSTAGTYTATLTVTDSKSNTASKSVTITVSAAAALTASASASPTSGTAPLAVTFTGSASGGTSPYTWSWAFGDSTTSTTQSPSHTYSTAGTYTATLTVTDSKSNTATSSVTITASAAAALSASAKASPTSGTAPLAVTFTGSASGGTSPYTWSWAFGDSSTSTSQNPSHTYSAAGTYTATLTVTDSKSNTATSSVTITVTAAPAGCTTPIAVTIGTQVGGSLAKGGCVLYSAAMTETQWDDYYYLDAYETDGTVTGSQPVFTLYAGMSPPTLTTSNDAKSKAGPNAAMTISLNKDSANTWGGWGTYEFLIQASSSGSGTYCFVADLSNSGHGTSPACTAPTIVTETHTPGTAQSSPSLTSISAYFLPFPFLGGIVVSIGRSPDEERTARRP